MKARLLPLLGLLCVSGVASGDVGADRAWRELFAQPGSAAAASRIEAVLSAVGNDVNKLRSLIASDVAYGQFAAGWSRQQASLSGGPGRAVTFAVRVPAEYTPQEPWPAILALHGGSGDGRTVGELVESLLGQDLEQYVIVAPFIGFIQELTSDAGQEEALLAPLRWTRLNLNIDDDRIYLVGYAQGGHCCWHLATMYPRLFAAAVSMGGLPHFEGLPYTSDMYMENLVGFAMWALWLSPPAEDTGVIYGGQLCRAAAARLKALKSTLFTGTEVQGTEVQQCVPAPEDFARFLRAHRREPRPARLRHFFHLPHHARSYYIEAFDLAHEPLDFAKRVTIMLPKGQLPTKEAGQKAKKRYYAKHLFKLRSEIDTQANTCSPRGYGVRGLKLYVTDGMFDLTRPVTIKYWSRTWSGIVKPSAECMLRHYAATRDQGALILNEIDMTIYGRLDFRY